MGNYEEIPRSYFYVRHFQPERGVLPLRRTAFNVAKLALGANRHV